MRLSIFMILFFTLSLQAQDALIGIKGGLIIANVSGEDRDVFSSSIDFQAGLFTETHLARQLLLKRELLFAVYGYEQEDAEISKVRLNIRHTIKG